MEATEAISHTLKRCRYCFFIAALIILLVPNFILVYYSSELDGISAVAVFLLLSVLFWLLVFALFGKKVFMILGFLSVLISPIEIITIKTLKMPLNKGLTEAVLHTNLAETKEQVGANYPYLLLLILLLFLFYYCTKNIGKNLFSSKVLLLFATFFLLLNLGVFYKMYSIQPGTLSNGKRVWKASLNTLLKYKKIYPLNIFTNLTEVLVDKYKTRQLMEQLEQFSFDARCETPTDSPQVVVLVIGETARYNNFHINGYKKPTTPNLDTISNLISFNDFYSSGSVTDLSVPQIITRARPSDFSIQYREKTIVDAFKEAGYYTAWMSTQNMSLPVINRVEKIVDYHYNPVISFDSKDFYDGELLPVLSDVLNKKEYPKKLIVLHTMGSHFLYSYRYPGAFEQFRPAVPKSHFAVGQLSVNQKEKLVNAYDNSILYTDYFLARVIAQLKNLQTPAGLVYLSDHGENLFDDDRNLILHGNDVVTPFDYHIPFIVWYSNSFKANYTKKAIALLDNKNRKSGTNNVFYTLLDMGDINYKDYNKDYAQSLANPQFHPFSKRQLITTSYQVIDLD